MGLLNVNTIMFILCTILEARQFLASLSIVAVVTTSFVLHLLSFTFAIIFGTNVLFVQRRKPHKVIIEMVSRKDNSIKDGHLLCSTFGKKMTCGKYGRLLVQYTRLKAWQVSCTSFCCFLHFIFFLHPKYKQDLPLRYGFHRGITPRRTSSQE